MLALFNLSFLTALFLGWIAVMVLGFFLLYIRDKPDEKKRR